LKNKDKKPGMPKKILIGGAVLAAAYGVYRSVRYFMTRSAGNAVPVNTSASIQQPAIPKTQPAKPQAQPVFPLKIGSEGLRVKQLQQALVKLGAKITVDGEFGISTAEQLNTRGFPAFLDEGSFRTLMLKAGNPVAANTHPVKKKANGPMSGLMDDKAMVYTITKTYVTDTQNNRVPVAKGAKLGTMISIKNNMVFFRDSQGQSKAVPYNTIRYDV
jgi:peptidoglycan hydrolase-like protein with peptidoglycan-binding domain